MVVVGLPDKAIGESRERVRASMAALGLGLPPRRVIVNLSPADLDKEGSHYDLPIAIALLAALDVLDREEVSQLVALGELALDGTIRAVNGMLPAAIAAQRLGRTLVCPEAGGAEATWSGHEEIVAAPSLIALVNHLKGTQLLAPPRRPELDMSASHPDLRDVRGQLVAKRALEIAAAGSHNLLMVGPPGSGKSMLAQRLPGILPPLEPAEALEVSMIHSVAGQLAGGRIVHRRPFRDPHHSASLAALVGGGVRVKPGEVSLAHHGVLFLDELPEFQRPALEALRQPIESGRAVVARANAHVSFPARTQLVAAMNPCRCGYLADPQRACRNAPACAQDYQGRISGPLIDRIDLRVEVPAVPPQELIHAAPGEDSSRVAARVNAARDVARNRNGVRANAALDGDMLAHHAALDADGHQLLAQAAEKLKLSARALHRVLRVARSVADLAEEKRVRRPHLAEALSYRGAASLRG
jgi:magnesium chelatase family protein